MGEERRDNPSEGVRSYVDLAEAVRQTDVGYELLIAPWEYRAIINDVQAPHQHGAEWAFAFRQALVERWPDDFGWHRQPEPVRVVVSTRPSDFDERSAPS